MKATRQLYAILALAMFSAAVWAQTVNVNTASLVYTPITPCRIVDTRVTGGPFAAKETRTFSTNGAATQGGASCTVYSDTIPAALSLNVTVDATSLGNPAQYGYLSVTPAPGSGSSWMNFTGGQTIANAGVASINQADGSFAIKSQNPSNVVVDVFGYYTQAPIVSGGLLYDNPQFTVDSTGSSPALNKSTTYGGAYAPTVADNYFFFAVDGIYRFFETCRVQASVSSATTPFTVSLYMDDQIYSIAFEPTASATVTTVDRTIMGESVASHFVGEGMTIYMQTSGPTVTIPASSCHMSTTYLGPK